MRLFYSLSLLLLCLAAAFPRTAQAEQPLIEVDGAPFSIAVHPKMSVSYPPRDGEAGLAASARLPLDITDLFIAQFTWPKSEKVCSLIVADRGADFTRRQSGEKLQSFLAVVDSSGKAQPLAIPQELATGLLSRVCVWPTSVNAEGELVFICSFYSDSSYDTGLYGFSLKPDGTLRNLDVGGARTLFSWFEVEDIDNDDDYELITSRSLDGIAGGFFYHALRSYDNAGNSYGPAPDEFREYFTAELAWLDWVVNTRALIQASPEQYMRASGEGHVFNAEYMQTSYGFDSLIEVRPGFLGMEDVTQYNEERREAFRLVKGYRDELKSWLAGGSYPTAWKL